MRTTFTDAVGGDTWNAAEINAMAAELNTKVAGSSNGTPTALTLWKGTAAQYAAIGTKDNNTVYVVT